MEDTPPLRAPRPSGAWSGAASKGTAERQQQQQPCTSGGGTLNLTEQPPAVAAVVVADHPTPTAAVIMDMPDAGCSGCCARYGARAAVVVGAVYAGCSLFTLSRAIEAITTPSHCEDVCDDQDPSTCSYHCFRGGWCKHGDITATNGVHSNIACPDDTTNPITVTALGVLSSLCALFCVVLIAVFPRCCSCDCFGGCHRHSKSNSARARAHASRVQAALWPAPGP